MLLCRDVNPKILYSRKVLIVKLSALGDILHALPALKYLRRTAPSLEIHWASDASFAELLAGCPEVVKAVPFPFREWKKQSFSPKTWKEVLGAVRALRRERYDIAIDIQGNLKSGLVTRLSGAPLRIGFDRDGVREAPNLLLTNRKARLLPEDRHVSRKYLRVASCLFGEPFEPSDLSPDLSVSAEDRDAAASLVKELLGDAVFRVAVHSGSTWPTKRMSKVFWAGVILSLRERCPAVGVLLSWGSEEERREALEIREMAGGSVELLPRLSIMRLAAVYRECGFVMAPDTGPLHLAAAVGAATVSVFRATDGLRNAPDGASHRFLQAPMECTACLRKECDRNQMCLDSVSSLEAAELMAGLMGA
ncbi:MAG: glycosyltransferase family 9 protein [Syntrophorhabdaceae bacterium]|nr:glycosyltransferase family 9 protein [Syntrophorhabdaceae bacterium]